MNETFLRGPFYGQSPLPNAGEVRRRGDHRRGEEHEFSEG
jgi:hypothetical protein